MKDMIDEINEMIGELNLQQSSMIYGNFDGDTILTLINGVSMALEKIKILDAHIEGLSEMHN